VFSPCRDASRFAAASNQQSAFNLSLGDLHFRRINVNKAILVTNPLTWSMTLLMTALVAGCGGGASGGGAVAPATQVGAVCSGAGCVSLGTSANYVILAKAGVSTVPSSVVTGNVGLSPAARGFLTGWSLIGEPTDTAYTSAQVVGGGHLYAADMVGGGDIC
jgi:hypothetical protein